MKLLSLIAGHAPTFTIPHAISKIKCIFCFSQHANTVVRVFAETVIFLNTVDYSAWPIAYNMIVNYPYF